jgi:hypothetical protein
MKKENKFLYGYKLYVDYGYGHGWEYEIFEETFSEIKKRKKEYLENCNYPLKVSRGREENPRYKKEGV